MNPASDNLALIVLSHGEAAKLVMGGGHSYGLL